MKLQYLCHFIRMAGLVGFIATSAAAEPSRGGTSDEGLPKNNYPTSARVEYVNDCIGKHGGKLANLYQCACAIDRIANVMTYDEFVESSTFAKYATLSGQGGGIFRDTDYSRKLAKAFRESEADSLRACGMTL